MSLSNLDQNQTPQTSTETWIQNSGLNPRTDWDIDWEKEIEEDGPVAVRFEPFTSLYPIYCACHRVSGDYALLKVPPKGEGDNGLTDWFPTIGESWVIVPEIFLRLQ